MSLPDATHRRSKPGLVVRQNCAALPFLSSSSLRSLLSIFLADPSGVWLVGPAFFIGIQLRRAKMAIDFILTWPLMEKFIDWQAVYRDAGTVEEVEF